MVSWGFTSSIQQTEKFKGVTLHQNIMKLIILRSPFSHNLMGALHKQELSGDLTPSPHHIISQENN